MGQNLTQIERQLERLEAAVVQEYAARKLDALRDGAERIALDEARLDRFAEELGKLERELYATGDPRRLQIVSEQHDAIRIRMIYIQHVLEREIPKPYADEALFEGDRALASPGREPVARKGPARPSLLGRMFPRGEPPRPATAPPRPAAPALTNEMRLIHLHRLMEQDTKQLMKPEERPPHVEAETPAAQAAYRFKVKFIAEAHHGQRVAPSEKIARTPEELRAKLARRDQDPGPK